MKRHALQTFLIFWSAISTASALTALLSLSAEEVDAMARRAP